MIKLAGSDGTLSKEQFIKILRSSNFFLKVMMIYLMQQMYLIYQIHMIYLMQTFDKNSDGIVSETEMTTRAELAFKVIAILVGITLDACNILIFNKTALIMYYILTH